MYKLLVPFAIIIATIISCKETAKNKVAAESKSYILLEVIYFSKTQLDKSLDTNNIDGNSIPSLGVPRIIGHGEQGEPYYLIKRR